MIQVHRLNGKEFVVNCELIKYLEFTPGTVVTLTTGEKLMIFVKPWTSKDPATARWKHRTRSE